ncbi:MAG TPA: VOC family protein [Polyangia bacterium]|nr:VOC family protein [Polyangia bacterium]
MSKVKAVPEGYHTVTPFLNVVGANDAIAFYVKAFGAEERLRMPGPDGKLVHGEIKIGDSIVMVSDALMNPPTSSSIHLYVEDADAAWSRATAAGAEVAMPIADQFWGDRYGVLKDKWGNRWAISQHKEDLSPEEMRARSAEAMKAMAQAPKP